MKAMPALHLDHQRRARLQLRRGTVLLAAALVACVAAGACYLALVMQAEEWQAGAERLERAGQPRVAAGPARATSELAAEVRRANDTMRQIALPWERLFEAVESAGSAEIALLALEPNPEQGSVKISGEARNMASLLAYMRALQGSEVFGAVYLQSHKVRRQEAQKPVRFLLVADWRRQP